MAPNNALSKSDLGNEEHNQTSQQQIPSNQTEPGASERTFNATPEWIAAEAQRGVISAEEVRSRGDGIEKEKKMPLGVLGGEYKRFLTVVMFLTRLPVPSWCDHNPVDLVAGMMWFPVVGAGVGFWCGTWFNGIVWFLGSNVAACASTMAGVWLTGCFHEDGLADTLDSFGGGWTRSQILRIMKDSRCGTYAVVGSSLALAAKVFLLSRIHEQDIVSVSHAYLVSHTVGRCCAVILCASFPYIHDEEDDKGVLYNTFAGCLELGLLTKTRVALAVMFTAIWTLYMLPCAQALAVLVVASAMTISAGKYAISVLGGVIGDYLGATIILIEIGTYVTMAVDVRTLISLHNHPALYDVIKLACLAGLAGTYVAGPGGFLARISTSC